MVRNGFAERFEVGDSVCGVSDYYPTWLAALRAAQWAQSHTHAECAVTIYDRMAHYGQPETWGANGHCLSIRER